MAFSQVKDLHRLAIGFCAIVTSCWFLAANWPEVTIVAAALYFIIACTTDTLESKIPNYVNASLALTGLTINTWLGGWQGTLLSLTGLGLGFGLLLLPWLMGGFGAGDVKALGALGALIGPKPLLHVFVYMAFFGGAMAVLHYLFERDLKVKAAEWWVSVKASALTMDPRLIKPSKTEPLRFPYAAAIAFGYYTYLTYGGVL
jgi:prepilin peptidase CpaA